VIDRALPWPIQKGMAQRRPFVATVCVVVMGSLLAPSATLASRASHAATLDSTVLHALNVIRAEHGLAALTLSLQLSAAADQHSRDMIADGYFGHSSPDGSAFWKRIAHYYTSSSYTFWSVGENLLWSPGQLDASATITNWMASPLHRANILFPGWRQIGIGSLSSEDAPGTYGSQAVTVVTTDFGVRR